VQRKYRSGNGRSRKENMDYYNNPEHITKWNFAADTWQMSESRNDMRVMENTVPEWKPQRRKLGLILMIYDEIIQQSFTYTLGDKSNRNL
jgi:uncharacterized protein YndB with AHSA1/START domain